jgi:hypothetical protein
LRVGTTVAWRNKDDIPQYRHLSRPIIQVARSDLFLAAPLHFPSDLRDDVSARGFSEGDAARPITASQPPGHACKTCKHYRSRLARPLAGVVQKGISLNPPEGRSP